MRLGELIAQAIDEMRGVLPGALALMHWYLASRARLAGAFVWRPRWQWVTTVV
jgi:hypothetical protein